MCRIERDRGRRRWCRRFAITVVMRVSLSATTMTTKGECGTDLSTSSNLTDEILCRYLRNPPENSLCALLVAIQPLLGLLPRLGASSFDHVAKQRPGAGAETNEGNLSGEGVAGEGDGGVDVVEFGKDVGGAIEETFLGVGGVEEGRGEVRTDSAEHLDLHSHGLGDDEDVGEDDGGVEEAVEAPNGLHGDFAG